MDGVQSYNLLNFFIVQNNFTEKMNPAYSKANVFIFCRKVVSLVLKYVMYTLF